MPRISVDVDLDEFDFEDVLEYVIDELKGPFRKEKVKSLISELTDDPRIVVESLDDEMKYEHIAKVFHKYSTDHFEKQLPL